MSTTSNNSQAVVERATIAAQSATTVQELRRALSILIPAFFGATNQKTAQAIGVGHAMVSRLRASFSEPKAGQDSDAKTTWGGRRNAWLSFSNQKSPKDAR